MSDLATRLRDLADWIETNAPDATYASAHVNGITSAHVSDARFAKLATGDVRQISSDIGNFAFAELEGVQLVGDIHPLNAVAAK